MRNFGLVLKDEISMFNLRIFHRNVSHRSTVQQKTRMAVGPGSNSDAINLFKDEFKYYKRRNPPADLSGVIDFTRGDCGGCVPLDDYSVSVEMCHSVGLRPVSTWNAYTSSHLPGFLFLRDPFLGPGSHRYWITRSVRDFPCKPNLTNLDLHGDGVKNVWKEHLKTLHSVIPSKTLMRKLRWATLGYHYDWDTKMYYSDRYTPLPADIHQLTRVLALALGFGEFNAEAGIVNFYHSDSSLGGHTDHSEYNLDAPLLSVSLGCDAIFLLGGLTRCVKPCAMFVRNGDVIVMHGEARLAYHGLPKILPSTFPNCPPPGTHSNNDECECQCSFCNFSQCSEEEWAEIGGYMDNSRVNLSIRQVLSTGLKFSDYSSPTQS